MSDWLQPALTYAKSWLEFQVRQGDLPGLQFAVATRDGLATEAAFGKPAASSREPLTTSHIFRVASHSKTFTAAAIMKLVDAGRLRLDDRADLYVKGLHADTATATIRQLLSHTAGIIRDGTDAGQWQLRRPFLDDSELRLALADAPILPANTRVKYSNHGFGLLGLIIESVTGERYADWIAREVVAAAGLKQTWPDVPTNSTAKLVRGHGIRSLLGERFEVDIALGTGALASATGFSSTASDLARFFQQLSPEASNSWLSVASRREMSRRHWRIPEMSIERYYGLGTIQGGEGAWSWFGHSGAFPGCYSHTSVLPAHGLTVSIIVNALEVQPAMLVDGVIAILRGYSEGGAPTAATAKWSGRWWTLFGASDLVPMQDKVLVTMPSLLNPMMDATELGDVSETRARIVKAGGFMSYGEPASLKSGASGAVEELWLGGTKLLPEAAVAAEEPGRFLKS